MQKCYSIGEHALLTRGPVREGFEPSDRPRRLFNAGLPMKKLSLVVDVISVLLVILPPVPFAD